MKILIGVDDSPYSEAAVQYVIGMKLPSSTQMVVVSAVHPPVPVYTEVYAPAALPNEGLLEDLTRVHQELVSRAERVLQSAGFKTEARVLNGDPREALVEAARVEGVDLLVVGSHGRSGIAKLVMGSVASYVMSHAPCSVLVVKSVAQSDK